MIYGDPESTNNRIGLNHWAEQEASQQNNFLQSKNQMRQRAGRKKYFIYLLSFLIMVYSSSCQTQKQRKPHGKLKVGKRIPCPIVDC